MPAPAGQSRQFKDYRNFADTRAPTVGRDGNQHLGKEIAVRSPSMRLAGMSLVLFLGLAGSLLATTSPAAAAVPGLVRVSATSASDSLDFKSVTATCPVGKALIGTGYQINGATGEVVVDDFRPNGGPAAAPTSLFVGAYEEDPFAGNWTITAFAICANPLPGLVRIASTGASGSLDFQSVTATCPAGKALLGTGYELNGALGEAVVDDFVPSGGTAAAPTSLFVGAYEADPNFLGNWTITAYAICANPLPGLVRIAVTSAFDSADFHSANAVCTAGKVLTGAGFELNGATGEAVVDDFVPSGGTATPPTGIFVGAYEADPDFLPSWEVTAYAICATP
jgi:hypothetical protein